MTSWGKVCTLNCIYLHIISSISECRLRVLHLSVALSDERKCVLWSWYICILDKSKPCISFIQLYLYFTITLDACLDFGSSLLNLLRLIPKYLKISTVMLTYTPSSVEHRMFFMIRKPRCVFPLIMFLWLPCLSSWLLIYSVRFRFALPFSFSWKYLEKRILYIGTFIYRTTYFFTHIYHVCKISSSLLLVRFLLQLNLLEILESFKSIEDKFVQYDCFNQRK